jgi:NUMOD4 motif/HNH endonuclease
MICYRDELWLDIAGYDGLYQVSSCGRVRSLWYKNKTRNAVRSTPLILKTQLHRYHYIILSKDGARVRYAVHSLVLIAFRGPRPNPSAECGHLDGNPDNNAAYNLAWVSAQENASHRTIHGTQTRGALHPVAKLTEADALAIKTGYRKGSKDAHIGIFANRYGITKAAVHKLVTGKTWAHLSLEAKQ